MDRNKSRADRDFGPHVVRNQAQDLKRSLRGLEREGFRYVHILNGSEEIDAATITSVSRCGTTARMNTGHSISSATSAAVSMS